MRCGGAYTRPTLPPRSHYCPASSRAARRLSKCATSRSPETPRTRSSGSRVRVPARCRETRRTGRCDHALHLPPRHERSTTMSPLNDAKGLAARMGRWSANHWKTAVFGWLAFVVASLFLSMQIGTKQIDQNDANVGESHRADLIIQKAGFNVDAKGKSIEEQSELVLLQSKTLTVHDPAFAAAIRDAVKTLQGFPQVSKLRSPLAGESDLVSKDAHSAMVQFTPKGSYE